MMKSHHDKKMFYDHECSDFINGIKFVYLHAEPKSFELIFPPDKD